MEGFNLLVSTSRGNEASASKEITGLLNKAGDPEATAEKIHIIGLVTAKTALDPFEAIRRIRLLLDERPELFRYTLKVVPLESVILTKTDEIRLACEKIAQKIDENETFRITVNKRHSDLSTNEIINSIASLFDRKVSLKNPDKIVLIEILGNLSGVAVIRPTDIFSVVKERFKR